VSPESFRQVVLEHNARVYTYAAWLLRDPEEARDVAQEAFLRLWQHREQVSKVAARAWLLTTAFRLCRDRMRLVSNGRLKRGMDLGSLLTDGGPSPPERLMSNDLRHQIGNALVELPMRERGVLLLREGQGLSYEELARVMDMPLGSVKTLLHRARRRLREALAGREVLV